MTFFSPGRLTSVPAPPPNPRRREPPDPGRVLRGGQFYSPLQSRLGTSETVLSELHQPCPRNFPRHEHELAYVTLVLTGDYLEGDHGKMSLLSPFTAAFNPSGIAHATIIGPAGASFFAIEFCAQGLERAQLDRRLPHDTLFDRGAGPILWPAVRLYSAFKAQGGAGSAASLAVESCTLELLGSLTELCPPEKSAPRWLHRVKDRLHDGFRERVRVHDLAGEAGVHPVHLARVFRRFENKTPGEYQQHLQVQAACRLLLHRDWPLAEIAAECGFADQSHFTRVFRRIARTTPGRFRSHIGAHAA